MSSTFNFEMKTNGFRAKYNGLYLVLMERGDNKQWFYVGGVVEFEHNMYS